MTSSRELVVWVELRPESADGLLLYNGNDRLKDFIAIALTHRHVQLRLRFTVQVNGTKLFGVFQFNLVSI